MNDRQIPDPGYPTPPEAGAIATPHHLATEAGVRAYRRGGNAIDAALAAAVSLTVTLPDNCALGGDLIALMREPDGEVLSINASGPAPAAISVDELRQAGRQMPSFGAQTVTVPGLLRGWEVLARQGAALTWRDHFDDAITQAVEGVPASPSMEQALDRDGDRLQADAGMRDLFFPGGRAIRAGQIFAQPQLARTLEQLAREGADCFYRGDVGQQWLKTLREAGSALTADDFGPFQSELTKPLSLTHAGQEILTAPPNSQGLLLLATLRMIGECKPPPDPLGAEAPALAQAFDRAIQIRDSYLGDPRCSAVDVERILSELGRPFASRATVERKVRGDTVAVVAADSDGRAVSLIQSVFDSFGSGILDPETGILAHNRGSFFSLDPASPNVLEPGKRPAHTLAPALALEKDELWAVLGTMGGLAQTQILTQLLCHLRRGAGAERAAAAPRWTIGGIESNADQASIQAERSVPVLARKALESVGWKIIDLPDLTFDVGEAQVITRGPDGRLAAASDPRSEGSSFAGPCRSG